MKQLLDERRPQPRETCVTPGRSMRIERREGDICGEGTDEDKAQSVFGRRHGDYEGISVEEEKRDNNNISRRNDKEKKKGKENKLELITDIVVLNFVINNNTNNNHIHIRYSSL